MSGCLTISKVLKMTEANALKRIYDEIEILQSRIGGAEYVIKYLSQKLPPNEINDLIAEMEEAIKNYGEGSAVAKIMDEGLRVLRA